MSEDLNWDELEDLVRNQAKDFQLKPSEAPWTKIESKLKRRRNSRILFRVAATLLCLVGSGWLYFAVLHPSQHIPGTSLFNLPGTGHPQNKFPKNRNEAVIPGTWVPLLHYPPGSPSGMRSHLPSWKAKPSALLSATGSKGITLFPAKKSTFQKGRPPGATLTFPQPPFRWKISEIQSLSGSLPSYELPVSNSLMDSAQWSESNALATSLAGIAFLTPYQSSLNPASIPGPSLTRKLSRKNHQSPLLELFLTPGVSYRSLFQNHDPSVYRYNPYLTLTAVNLSVPYSIQSENLNQHPDFGFSAGAHLKFHLWKKLHLITGLQLDKFGYTIKAVQMDPVYVPSAGNYFYGQGSTNNPYPSAGNNSSLGVYTNYASSLSKVVTIHNRFLGIEIPLLLNLEFPLKNRWGLSFTSGVGVNFLLYKHIQIISPTYQRYFSDNSLVKNRDLIYDLNTSLSIPLSKKKKIALLLGPDFQYLLFSTYSPNYMVEEHPFTFGLRMGVSFRP
ncbi:MAG: hypothetical protein ACYCOO_03225 [Chitinophagaceae bacterium]